VLRKPALQRLNEAVNFVHALMYSCKITRWLNALGAGLPIERSRHPVRELVEFGELSLQNPLEEPCLSYLGGLHWARQRVGRSMAVGSFRQDGAAGVFDGGNPWSSIACGSVGPSQKTRRLDGLRHVTLLTPTPAVHQAATYSHGA
jgi:hypothetical protein